MYNRDQKKNELSIHTLVPNLWKLYIYVVEPKLVADGPAGTGGKINMATAVQKNIEQFKCTESSATQLLLLIYPF